MHTNSNVVSADYHRQKKQVFEERLKTNDRKDVQQQEPLEKHKLRPKWDLTAHLPEQLK